MISCEKTEQTMTYYVEIVDFNDNMDILRSSIDKGFEEAGFQSSLNHIWQTFGTESSCNKKATTAFQKRVKEIEEKKNNAFSIKSSILLKNKRNNSFPE